jgi:arabinose-5-phosphate isomerase
MAASSPEQIVSRARAIIEREAAAVAGVSGQLDHRLAEVVGMMLACRGHVLTLGAGTSHAVAARLAHLLACSGVPALALNPADAVHGGSGSITAADLLFVISKGGRSDEINQTAAIARERGAAVVALTEDPDAPLAALSDVVLCVRPAPGVDPFDMVATGSSLVNCAVGDALCVLLLEEGGYSRDQFGQTHPGGAVGRKLAGPPVER